MSTNPKTLYRHYLRQLILACDRYAELNWGVGIRLLDFRDDDMAYIRIGERNGLIAWIEYQWPEQTVFRLDKYPVAPKSLRHVYAHTYGLPKLKARTVTNLRSVRHMALFMLKSWELVKYQERIT